MKNSKKYLKHWLWLLYCHNAVFELRCCYHPVHPGHVAKRKKNTDQNNIIFFRLPTWPHWNTTNHGNIFSSKIHGSLTTPRPWQCEDLQGFGRIIARSRLFPDNYKKAISSGGVAKKKDTFVESIIFPQISKKVFRVNILIFWQRLSSL